jgi:hypothetical protein
MELNGLTGIFGKVELTRVIKWDELFLVIGKDKLACLLRMSRVAEVNNIG